MNIYNSRNIHEMSISEISKIKKRDNSIDFLKGILTLLMTLSHFLYITNWKGMLIEGIHDYVDLTTFSGFLFCFGYVSWFSYIDNDNPDVTKRIWISIIKILLAYNISGLAFVASKDSITINNVISILLFQTLPGITEFLLSFILVDVVVVVFRNKMRYLKTYMIVIFILVCLMLCYFPYEIIVSPVMGNIIGKENGYYFPIIQYGSYYLFGILLAKKKIIFNKYMFVITAFMTCMYYLLSNLIDKPKRFPPSILFIIGAAFFIYLYFLVSKYLCTKEIHIKFIEFIGRHTLIYLVIGNMIVFYGQWRITHSKKMLDINSINDVWKFIMMYITGLILSYFVSLIVDKILSYGKTSKAVYMK